MRAVLPVECRLHFPASHTHAAEQCRGTSSPSVSIAGRRGGTHAYTVSHDPCQDWDGGGEQMGFNTGKLSYPPKKGGLVTEFFAEKLNFCLHFLKLQEEMSHTLQFFFPIGALRRE